MALDSSTLRSNNSFSSLEYKSHRTHQLSLACNITNATEKRLVFTQSQRANAAFKCLSELENFKVMKS